MGVIPPAFLKGPSRCFGALEGGQVFGLFVVVRCAGVHCYVNEVHLEHFSIANLVLALFYHTLFNKAHVFVTLNVTEKRATICNENNTFRASSVSPDASRQFSVLPLLFSYLVRMLIENLSYFVM